MGQLLKLLCIVAHSDDKSIGLGGRERETDLFADLRGHSA